MVVSVNTRRTNGSSDRVFYADLLRIIATFGVINIHVAATQWYTANLDWNWQMLNVFHSCTRFSVPIFFMLSGMFFLNPDKEIGVKRIYSKYIARIVAALFFWGLAYNFSVIIVRNLKGLSAGEIPLSSVAMQCAKSAAKIPFGTAWYHLWFLYAIIPLYILTPVFRVFTKSAERKDFEYLMIISALFGTILPAAKTLLLKIDARMDLNFSITELSGYAVYFFAGYYFSHFEISKKVCGCIVAAGILSILFTILATAFVSLKAKEPCGYFYENLLPTTMFSAFGLFLLVKSFSESRPFSEKMKKVITEISKMTFGIYLTHDFFNLIFGKIGFSATFFTPIVTVPLRTVITFILSALVVSVIRKIPLLNKYVI